MKSLKVENIETPLKNFHAVFKSDEDCLNLLANLKWEKGYKCSKCANTNYCGGKQPYSRRCTRCKKEESATANTIFHRCKFPLVKAFEILLLACQAPAISSYKVSEYLEMRHMTCYNFKKKILDCRENNKDSRFISKLILSINREMNSIK
ncbi:MAG: hypothetical protein C0598_10115 [Marinilabiliales bacterium]|nr:MAG: hypothetical protein C0598_10115 [Marinilabiliales bacterium]